MIRKCNCCGNNYDTTNGGCAGSSGLIKHIKDSYFSGINCATNKWGKLYTWDCDDCGVPIKVCDDCVDKLKKYLCHECIRDEKIEKVLDLK